VSIAYNKAYVVGHQLVISLAYYNNNLALQLYFNGIKHYLLLRRSYDVPKICYSESRGCTCLRAPMNGVDLHMSL